LDIGGEPDHPVEGQILRERIVHLGHVLEAGPILAGQLLVHVHHDIVVLGVDRGDATGRASTCNTSRCRRNRPCGPCGWA